MKDRLIKIKELLEYLKQIEIPVKTEVHPEVVSCAESKCYYDALGYDEKDYGLCKNIFIRDKKGKQFWLVIVDHQKMIDMDELKSVLRSTKKVGFATTRDLASILGVEPGSVSLFSVINDIEKRVKVIIDESLLDKKMLAFHPNYRGLTSFISSSDTIRFLDSVGSEYSIIDVPSKEKRIYNEFEQPMVKTLSYHI